MKMLSTANLQRTWRFEPATIASVAGMAIVWLSLFKQMLYPVMYAYYRTGNEGTPHGQAVYSAVLVVVIFGLLIAFERSGAFLLERRGVVFAVGLGGAAGIALVAFGGRAFPDNAALTAVGAALSALYVPVHFAFWALNAKSRRAGSAMRAIACSFALFCVAAIGLTALGLNTATVSVACPLASSVLALASPKAGDGEREAAGNEAAFTPSATASEDAVTGEQGDAPPEPTTTDPSAASSRLPDGFAQSFGLSEREAELAAYACRNWSARKIAGELFIAESTVYTHLKRIYRKTDVHSKQELIDLVESWNQTLAS